MSEFLRFALIGEKPKTKVYAVLSARHGDRLGRISWYGPWRQYVFTPSPGSIWSDGCLREVAAFLAGLHEQRQASRKGAKAQRTEGEATT